MAAYNPAVDYSALIAQEAAKGVNADRQLLAQYEAQRNAKITGERLPYRQTAVYTSELGRPLGYYAAEDRSDYINEIYDAARELSLEALEREYESEVTAFDYAAGQIPQQYREARNAAASGSALARQSVNEQFAASGLNTGAAGQARLSLAVAGQGTLAGLDRERARALSELELQRAQAESDYRRAVAEAITSSELERAQALYDEAVRVESSYRAYSEELLSAWGLTLSGQPVEAQEGTGTYYNTAAARQSGGETTRDTTDSVKETVDSDYELLKDQLQRIPGLTGMNKAAMVEDFYNNGRITYEEKRRLLQSIQ